jgi:hypothetical protein
VQNERNSNKRFFKRELVNQRMLSFADVNLKGEEEQRILRWFFHPKESLLARFLCVQRTQFLFFVV